MITYYEERRESWFDQIYIKVYDGMDPKDQNMIKEIAGKVTEQYLGHVESVKQDKLRRCDSHGEYKGCANFCEACGFYLKREDSGCSCTGKYVETTHCNKCGKEWSEDW